MAKHVISLGYEKELASTLNGWAGGLSSATPRVGARPGSGTMTNHLCSRPLLQTVFCSCCFEGTRRWANMAGVLANRLRLVMRATPVVLFGSSAACSDDEGSTTPPEPTTLLSELTGGQAQALCERWSSALAGADLCATWGMAAAFNLAYDENYAGGSPPPPSDDVLQRACRETVQQCEAASSESTSSAGCTGATTPRCAITVAEYEVCMAESLAMLEMQADATPRCEELACSSFPEVAQAYIDQRSGSSTLPASCERLLLECSDAMLPVREDTGMELEPLTELSCE
jgi:hypothetical protein